MFLEIALRPSFFQQFHLLVADLPAFFVFFQIITTMFNFADCSNLGGPAINLSLGHVKFFRFYSYRIQKN